MCGVRPAIALDSVITPKSRSLVTPAAWPCCALKRSLHTAVCSGVDGQRSTEQTRSGAVPERTRIQWNPRVKTVIPLLSLTSHGCPQCHFYLSIITDDANYIMGCNFCWKRKHRMHKALQMMSVWQVRLSEEETGHVTCKEHLALATIWIMFSISIWNVFP